MRILLSSIGRRGYLAQFFREAVRPGDEVWGGDCSPYASAFHDCDNSVLLPEVTAPGYVDELLGLCRRCGIDMLIPLIDLELEVLAHTRDRFFSAGIMAVVSPPRTIEIGYDKYLTYQFGKENGIPVPKTVISLAEAQQMLKSGELAWPVAVKPRKGSASMNISFCNRLQELEAAFHSCPLPMIQECLTGEEYGYDMFGDRQYRPISVFYKRKLAMRAGETDKAVSECDPELLALGRKIAESLEIFGPLDADIMEGQDGPKLLELNPRFGGGYPCAHLCGADFPRKLIALYHGETLTPDLDRAYPSGVYMFKQDDIISFSETAIESVRPYTQVAVAKPLSLLFCSAGRRVTLLQEFRRGAHDLGIRLVLHAADHNPLAPALQVADSAAIVPSIGPGYIGSLLAYCRKNRIDAVIPLLDPELPLLSDARESFAAADTKVIISSPEVIRISMDKVLTTKFLVENGFRTPRILSEEELRKPSYPLFVKPRDGSSSVEARKIIDQQALDYYLYVRPELIVQEFVDGVEYTVDVFVDFDGMPRCAVPRRRHEVRSGEVSKGQAIQHAQIMQESCRLTEVLRGCLGMMTIQCFLTPEDEVVFIEINPRFGGGVPLSIRAGADSPRWILELLLGRQPSISMHRWTNDLFMLRFDQAFFCRPEDVTYPEA